MLATAPNPITAAAIPKPTSSPLTLRTAEGSGRWAAGAPVVAPGGRVTGAPVLVGGRDAEAAVESVAPPEAVGGRGAAGAEAAGAGVAVAAEAGAAGAAAGPPAGTVGSLMVGEELGLGGRLMRTVSFLGWTFAASPGLGGTAPPGVMGLLSAIFRLLLPPN